MSAYRATPYAETLQHHPESPTTFTSLFLSILLLSISISISLAVLVILPL